MPTRPSGDISKRARLGIIIKKYAHDNYIKLSFIAKKMGITNASLYDILNGRNYISAENYVRICRILHVDLGLFVDTLERANMLAEESPNSLLEELDVYRYLQDKKIREEQAANKK